MDLPAEKRMVKPEYYNTAVDTSHHIHAALANEAADDARTASVQGGPCGRAGARGTIPDHPAWQAHLQSSGGKALPACTLKISCTCVYSLQTTRQYIINKSSWPGRLLCSSTVELSRCHCYIRPADKQTYLICVQQDSLRGVRCTSWRCRCNVTQCSRARQLVW